MLPAPDLLPGFLAGQIDLFPEYLPSQQLQISVVIPARNEATNLEATLDALRIQQQVNGKPFSTKLFEVLVLLNNCTDHSEDILRRYQLRYPDFPLRVAVVKLPPQSANVGTARRLLMNAAYLRFLQIDNQQGIIASTDGDTLVDPYWIDQIRTEIRNGCDVVGGRILTRPDGSSVRINHLRDVTFRMLKAKTEAYLDPLPFDPWPRHFQHFGASLALTCAAYEQAGGLPDVPNLEDEALYQALLRIDLRIRKSPKVQVFTSTRLHGQVDIGFSEQLRYWDAQNQASQAQLSEPAGSIINRLKNRHLLRLVWQNQAGNIPFPELKSIAKNLMIDAEWLIHQLNKTTYFGQLWEAVEAQMQTGDWKAYWQPVPITVTIAELRQFLQTAKLS